MSNKKVFRVVLREVGIYYLDVRANDEQEARAKVAKALMEGVAYPIENTFESSGYEFDNAYPIEEEEADIDADLEEKLANA